MAKANKKAIESGNFWDMRWVHGSLAGKPNVDADESRARHQKKKDRLCAERYHSKIPLYDTLIKMKRKITERQKPTKQQRTHNQIQYGFDIANWMMTEHA